MHPETAIARSRATKDAMHNRYDNREHSQRGKVAYDSKYAALRRVIDELESPRANDEDVKRATL